MWCSSAGRGLPAAPVLYLQWLVVSLMHNEMFLAPCLLHHETELYMSPVHCITDTQLLWVHLYCSLDHQHDLQDHFEEIIVLLLLYQTGLVLIMSLHVNKLIVVVCAKTALHLKNISFAQKCSSVLLFLPKVKPVLSHFLEPGVFICYSAAVSKL